MHAYHVSSLLFLCTKQQYGVNVTTNNVEVVERSQIIWLAVKPHAIGRVLREVTPVVRPDQLIISTAAGIPIKEIEKVLSCLKKMESMAVFMSVYKYPVHQD